jgi:hypothetical protein
MRQAPVVEPERSRALEVVVVDTGIRETLEGLRIAAELAAGLAARIRILIAEVVPYPLPLDASPVANGRYLRRLRTVAEGCRVDTLLDVRLCRDATEAIEAALPVRSLVVITGRRLWWPTREKRLARRLTRLGHQVFYREME